VISKGIKVLTSVSKVLRIVPNFTIVTSINLISRMDKTPLGVKEVHKKCICYCKLSKCVVSVVQAKDCYRAIVERFGRDVAVLVLEYSSE